MTIVHRFLAEPLPRAVANALERLAAARGVRRVAVMPDVHLADDVCVGTVVGTDAWLYPQAVGADIGCGMAVVRIAAARDAIADEAAARRVLAALRERIPRVRRYQARDVTIGELSDDVLARRVARDARIEFGTIGRGNHFVEVQADDDDALWLVVHTGSRAIGPAVKAHHLARGEPVGGGLVALAADGGGAAYLHDAAVAVDYARRNRRAIAESAADAFASAIGVGVDWDTWFDGTHDFVRRERHDGEDLWVHRKGANSARDAEVAIVPGSMGTPSFHVEGRGCGAAMCSSAHGAGRRLARGEAMRRISARDVVRQLGGTFFDSADVDRLRDEAPAAYKDIRAVMRAQGDLVRVVRVLRPVLTFK